MTYSGLKTALSSAWARWRRGEWRVRDTLAIACALLLALACFSWLARLTTAPIRRAGAPLSLANYGYPGVTLRIVYPTRVNYREGLPEPSVLTVYAQADSDASQREIELVFPLADEALTFVDTQGLPAPGRLRVLPGFPDALPHNLLLAHSGAQHQPSLLFARSVRVTPMLRTAEGTVPLGELSFRTSIESRLGRVLRGLVMWGSGWGLALAAAAALLAPLWAALQRVERRRRLAREQRLSALYTRLRDEIRVENWAEARAKVEELRLLAPGYRDLDQLDTLISTAETAAWRREQLYAAGLRAYRERDWPTAVQAFQRIEEETPYYRDVRFLRRTAALYADLRSRDRSLRIRAATQLGEVADLLDMQPLLQALGDRSREVADAAEASFARIGLAAVDTLIAGLAAETLQVRERAYRLLQGLGQSARDALLGALHSPDPRVTRSVARLLRGLGAREDLAQALLWSAPEHHPGIVEALVQDGQAACEPLVNALLQAHESQEQTLLGALAALKMQEDLSRYLENRARSADSERARQLLQRAARVPAQPFAVADLTKEAVEALPAEGERPADEVQPTQPENTPRSLVKRLGWLDRRR